MTTTADLIFKTQRRLMSGQRNVRNRLASSVSAGATSLVMTYDVSTINPGDRLAIDLEEFYVVSVTSSTKTVTVTPGEWGTTQATHASNALVHVNPRFSDFEVLGAINEDIDSLSSPANGLFRVLTADLTYSAAIQGYDLAGVTNLLDVYEVRYKAPGPDASWPLVNRWALSRNMAVGEFSSGLALELYEGGYPGFAIRLRYKAPYGLLSTTADDVATTTGMHTQAHDIPPLGSALRLVAPREIKRNFTETQGDPRRAEEVVPGAVAASMRGIGALRASRIAEEAARLETMYPTRIP